MPIPIAPKQPSSPHLAEKPGPSHIGGEIIRNTLGGNRWPKAGSTSSVEHGLSKDLPQSWISQSPYGGITREQIPQTIAGYLQDPYGQPLMFPACYSQPVYEENSLGYTASGQKSAIEYPHNQSPITPAFPSRNSLLQDPYIQKPPNIASFGQEGMFMPWLTWHRLTHTGTSVIEYPDRSLRLEPPVLSQQPCHLPTVSNDQSNKMCSGIGDIWAAITDGKEGYFNDQLFAQAHENFRQFFPDGA